MEICASAKPHLARVKNYQPGKPVEELQREYGVRGAIKLASNENALGPSPKAIAAAAKRLKEVHRYPDGGCFYLRKKLAAVHRVPADWLAFGNGSDELLVMVARAFAGHGSEVVIADPTFLIYEIASQAEGAAVVKVPMRYYRYDLEAMRARVNPRTRVVFIANPDNPVGTFVTAKEVSFFLRTLPSRVIVVLDEAYYEFAKERRTYPDSLELLRRHENLVVTRTFSKAYGLAGLRIGYAVARPPVIAALNRVREPFNVNLIAQAAAEAALDDRRHLEKTLKAVHEGRKYLTTQLRLMGLGTVDTATNFILADLKRPSQPVYEALLRRGVIIRSMTAWGMPHFIRVTIGTKKDNERFIRALKETLKGAVSR